MSRSPPPDRPHGLRTPPPETPRIVGATLLDPATGQVLPDHELQLARGHIVALRPARGRPGPGDLDARGRFLLPGLIDTHVHAMGLLMEQMPGPWDLRWVARQQRRNLRAFLRSGVTTVRDLGAPLGLIRRFSRAAARLRLVAPRILYSGPVLAVAGGYPHFVPPTPLHQRLLMGPLRVDLQSAAHARRVVRALRRGGACCVKLLRQATAYDDARSALPVMPRALCQAVIEEAHAQGLAVAMHAVYREDLLAVLDLPYDTTEHLPIDAPLSAQEVQRVVAARRPLTTTMMTYGIIDHQQELADLLDRPDGRLEEAPRAFLRRALQGLRSGEAISPFIGQRVTATGSRYLRENLGRLHAAGAIVSFGTDSGGAITPPGNPAWELADMARAGLSPMAALRAATATAADALGRSDLGRLQPGCAADLLLLDEDPLQDLRAVQRVAAVLRAGRQLYAAP